jgi:hypothetical protein
MMYMTGEANRRKKGAGERKRRAKSLCLAQGAEVPEAGRVEHDASALLEDKRVYMRYFKDGIPQTAIEVLKCSFSDAQNAIIETVGELSDYKTWEWTRAWRYEFS